MSLKDALQPLLALAFDETEAIKASAAIAFHRDERETAGLPRVRSYEVQARDGESALQFLERIIPRFQQHMDALNLPLRGSPGVFFSLFVEDRLYFIESEAVCDLYDRLRPIPMLPGRKH